MVARLKAYAANIAQGQPQHDSNGAEELNMKTDTEYFGIAVDNWCRKNAWGKDLPCTPSWFSQMLRDAQALKDADKKRLESAAQ